MNELKPSTRIKLLISGSDFPEIEKEEMYFFLCELEKEHEQMKQALSKIKDAFEKL